MTVAEAERIAASLGISLEGFRERYVDDSWFEPGYFLLDTQDGACIFLSVTEDSRITSCQIHQLRPRPCREWQAGLDRKECLEGLGEYWGLAVDSSGRICGSREKVREFRSVLKSGEFL